MSTNKLLIQDRSRLRRGAGNIIENINNLLFSVIDCEHANYTITTIVLFRLNEDQLIVN